MTGSDFSLSPGELAQAIPRLDQISSQSRAVLERKTLDEITDQKLLAEQAKVDGLDREPATMQAIEAAKRSILANSYIAHNSVPSEPTPGEVRRYFDTHQENYSDRELVSLQQVILLGSKGSLERVQTDVRNGVPVEKALAQASRNGLAMFSSEGVQSTDTMDPSLAAKVKQTAVGKWVVITSDSKLVCAFVRAKQAAPLSFENASGMIKARLTLQNKSALIAAQVASLRRQRHVSLNEDAFRQWSSAH